MTPPADVRGRHHDALGQMGLRHRQLGAIEHPTAAAVRSGGDRRDPADAQGNPVEGRGEHDVAGNDAREPTVLELFGTERGQRQRAEDQGGPQRDRSHHVALGLQQQAQLGQPVARAAVCLGHREPEEIRTGQRGPQLAVDHLVGKLDPHHPIGRDESREESLGGLGDRELFFGEGKIHQAAPLGAEVAGPNTGSDSSSSKSTNVA